MIVRTACGNARDRQGRLPPAKFFWSATLYTLPDRFLYANPINRYSIGKAISRRTRKTLTR